MAIPSVESCLPELISFVESLAGEAEQGGLADGLILAQKVRRFFTLEMMDKVNAILPGWKDMAAYADGQTLIHVMTVFAALLLCPEYRHATLDEQRLMQWIVLLHDLAKVVINNMRDATHSFRSAALAGTLLARCSTVTNDDFETRLTRWAALTMTATTSSPQGEGDIQDNHRLPEILVGVGQLFGQDTPAALIVKTVLFHQSLDVVSGWPQAAALTDTEIQRYLSLKLLPLLKMMMLVDNDAWALFDLETKRRGRNETLAAFRRVEALLQLSHQ